MELIAFYTSGKIHQKITKSPLVTPDGTIEVNENSVRLSQKATIQIYKPVKGTFREKLASVFEADNVTLESEEVSISIIFASGGKLELCYDEE